MPILVRIEDDLLHKAHSLLCESNLLFKKPLLVTMRDTKHLAEKVSSGFEEPHICLIENNSYPQVEELEQIVENKRPDVLIGVGGGKVVDVSKFTGSRRILPVVSIPTSLSNDGISSPVAVIRFRKGTRSVGVNMPTAVLVDLGIVATAPRQNLKAGVGDLISNISATNDWFFAYQRVQEHYDAVSAMLSRKPAMELLAFKTVDFENGAFLRTLAEGLVLSGIAMGIAGTSRPCSGSEHLLSHALDELYPGKSLHGEQVAMFSIFTTLLQKETSQSRQKEFLKVNSLLSSPGELKLGYNEFLKLIKKAPLTRPGRTTVLDKVSPEDIKKAYEEAYSGK